MATLGEVFEGIGTVIKEMNEEIDGIFAAGEYYKAATEELVDYLKQFGGFHVKDLEYSDGYFIFGKGTNSVVEFYIEETPDWLYGIWWEVEEMDLSNPEENRAALLEQLKTKGLTISGEFFCQYEPEIDKFKPSRSNFCSKLTIRVFDDFKYFDYWGKSLVEETIKYINKEPYLAWMHQYKGIDFNREYYSRRQARKAFKKYLRETKKEISTNVKIQLKWLKFIRKIFKTEKVYVRDSGEGWSPRFELFIRIDNFIDEQDEIIKNHQVECNIFDFPFEEWEINANCDMIKEKEKELQSKMKGYWFNLVSDFIRIVTDERFKELEDSGIELCEISEFINKVYPTIDKKELR